MINFACRSVPKEVAISTAVSTDLTKTGDFLEVFQPREKKVCVVPTYLHPGLFKILTTCLTVSARTFGGVMSIWHSNVDKGWWRKKTLNTFVMQTTTGTLSANAIARCSFDIPINPALAPTIRITHEGAPDVRPYNVVLRYRSWPARSKKKNMGEYPGIEVRVLPLKDTILAACNEISSHPSFSRRITSGSVEFAVLGNIGTPEGANPKI